MNKRHPKICPFRAHSLRAGQMTLWLRMRTSLPEQGDSSFCIHKWLPVLFRAGFSPCCYFTLIHRVSGFLSIIVQDKEYEPRRSCALAKGCPGRAFRSWLQVCLGAALTHWLSLLETPWICSSGGNFDVQVPGGKRVEDRSQQQPRNPTDCVCVSIADSASPSSAHACLYNISH